MLGITHFGFFLLAVFLLNVTPGPDTAYIIGRSVAQGRGAGLVSAAGIATGCGIHSLACAFGLTALIAASPAAFTVIKFAGAAYLIYLGVRLAFTKPAAPGAARPAAQSGPARPLRQLFVQGVTTNLLNPKVVLFFVSFFPQFVAADSAHKTLAFLVLGGVFVLQGLAWSALVAWAAGSLTRRLGGNAAVKKWLDRLVGGAFVGLGLRLAAATQR
ncbi:LysE family translocator [Burkholderia glumae]|uniref:LysE family translocator n=1 Tax=Burkholderia glumae TaxID=337 RepID=A0AAP9XZN1_BURGL|nr:LysE family translocator [Burkholderia glumae]ACR30470.1 Lysine exporter family protein LYSE/YGGA [Burkholderia glumae BGR1]AJY66990.1 lysE type translocator family protein [Burkholderia glumae LMG 2196 = ATCC 33617]KHJ63659.1 lysine transporter LysE [Burkholderia glumae]MCM2481878.1 LysE family translocator [Burkholderia glumae]MCM2507979.1 LysE family translocator [Burkholderia glumae]